MRFQFLAKPLCIGLITAMGSLSAYAGATGPIYSGSDFASLLKSPSACTSAGDCPSGAYFISSAEGAASLYKLGTIVGGSQDGHTPGVTSQWSTKRFAFLIGPGVYPMENPSTHSAEPFKINYYTQISGVDLNRDQVTIEPGINALNDCDTTLSPKPARCTTIGGLNNFWRSLGNLMMNSSGLLNPDGSAANALRYAVSQAAPIRNVHFEGLSGEVPGGGEKGLLMCDWNTANYACGYTSGGFMANSKIDGALLAGSQQQFYVTHSSFTDWTAGTWNMVSMSNTGSLTPSNVDTSTKSPWTDTPGFPFTNLSSQVDIPGAPRLVENSGNWAVTLGDQANTQYPVSEFTLIASDGDVPTTLTAADVANINASLQNNKGIIFMPGIYNVQATINVPNDKVVLGVGMSTLQCNSPTGACMTTGSEGVRVAGLTFDAGTTSTAANPENVLLTVGTQGEGSAASPDVLQDVYCRVARTDTSMASPSTHSCITVNANNAIGQNLWLWRADHDAQSGTDPNPENDLVPANIDQAQYGLIVNGNDVTMNGLFVEHFQNYLTVWNGQNGHVNFYQSELPYVLPEGDSASNPSVTCSTPDGEITYQAETCPSLYITKHATGFRGNGLGVYSYFAKQKIVAASAIEVAAGAQDVSITHAVTRWLNGITGSGINSIVQDDKGSYPADSAVNGLAEDGNTQGFALSTYSSQS